jgi:hypothetical protein
LKPTRQQPQQSNNSNLAFLHDLALAVERQYNNIKKRRPLDDGREHDATDDIPAYEESRNDYLLGAEDLGE